MGMLPCRRKKSSLLLLAAAAKKRRLGYAINSRNILRVCAVLHTTHCCCGCNTKESGKIRRWWRRPTFEGHDEHGAWATLIPIMREQDEDMFFNFMRMTPEAFDRLLSMVSPFITKVSWRKAIEPGERLAITLRYLASGDSQKSLSFLFLVSPQVISKIVLETTTVIYHVLKKKVFPELNEDLWLKTAAEFQVMWNIPHCLGAIDGKQVHVRAFPHCGSRYFGYKKRHCLTFMAVADAKHKFLVVESGASGKRADANIYHKSLFAQKLRNRSLNIPPPCEVEGVEGEMPFFFVGDNAYPRSENLATPFKGNHLRDEEMVYNYRLSRGRRIVENAFGVLAARYRILLGQIAGSISLVRSTVLCLLALHNFHLLDEESVPKRRKKYMPDGYCDYIRADGKYIFGRWRNEDGFKERSMLLKLHQQVSSRDKVKGEELSEMLINYFVFNPVPWQWDKANLLL